MEYILSASYLLTMESQQILHDYALVIKNGNILDILPRKQALEKYPLIPEKWLNDTLLMPSLINMHNHMAMVLFRGMADDLELNEWLQNNIWPAEQQRISDEFVRDGAKIAIAEMMLSGTSYSSDMYFFPEAVAEVAKQIGFKVQIAAPIIQFPNAWSQNYRQALDKIQNLCSKYQNDEFISIALGPHAPYTLTDDAFLAIKDFQLKNPHINLQIHLHETEAEVLQSIKEFGKRPIARLADLGVLNDRVQAVHMTQINTEDLDILRKYAVNIVHCPQSNLKLASGFAPIEKMYKTGLKIAIGTDGAASNNDLNMFAELQTAALLAKAVARDAKAFSAFNALKSSTIEAATILGKQSKIGSLAIGKSADICAIDASTINAKPNFSHLSNLVYGNIGNRVKHLWINGKQQVKDANLVNLDEIELCSLADKWQSNIAKSKI